MNNLFRISRLNLLILLIAGLVGCSKDDASDSELKISNATAVTNNDMIGHWSLTGMIADASVDLDGDQVSNRNLLEETDCFNTMSITFLVNGTFITNNAQMSFEGGDSKNEFSCLMDRMDTGDWVVRNDSLILSLEINAETYTHRKLINLRNNTFSLSVNRIESDQYVNDPGNTQASPIRILEVEYTKP